MNWLKQRREEIGIKTQEELARRLQLEGFSIGRASISHWENDRYHPPLEDPLFRKVLAVVLRLTEPELLRRAGYETVRTKRTAEAEIGADIIDQLPPEKRDLALRLLEQLRAS